MWFTGAGEETWPEVSEILKTSKTQENSEITASVDNGVIIIIIIIVLISALNLDLTQKSFLLSLTGIKWCIGFEGNISLFMDLPLCSSFS